MTSTLTMFSDILAHVNWVLLRKTDYGLMDWLFCFVCTLVAYAIGTTTLIPVLVAFVTGTLTASPLAFWEPSPETSLFITQAELELALTQAVLQVIDECQSEAETESEEVPEVEEELEDIPMLIVLHILVNGKLHSTTEQDPPSDTDDNDAPSDNDDNDGNGSPPGDPHTPPSQQPPPASTPVPVEPTTSTQSPDPPTPTNSTPSQRSPPTPPLILVDPPTLGTPRTPSPLHTPDTPPAALLHPTFDSVRESARKFILENRDLAGACVGVVKHAAAPRRANRPKEAERRSGGASCVPAAQWPAVPTVKMDMPLRRREQCFGARKWY